MDGGSGGLQSGIVFAAIVAAILFADRLGGADQIAQRVFQLALAATLAFVVMSGTLAFIRPPSTPYQLGSSSSSAFDSSGDSSSSSGTKVQQDYFRDVANRDSARSSVHFGAGVIMIVAGVAALRRWKTLGLGIAAAGLLLVLFGGIHTGSTDNSNPLTALYSSLFSAIGSIVGTSRRTDIIRFAVFAAGGLALIALGAWRWDMAPKPAAATPATEPE